MAPNATVFIPPDCAAPGASCNVHFFFHGCDVVDSYTPFSQYAGFNEWAMRNRFVVVYPKMGVKDKAINQMHSGCWDGYGDTGAYITRV